MRKSMLVTFAAAIATVATPITAMAHGGKPLVETQVVSGTNSVPFEGPCVAGLGTANLDFRNVFHITEFADGDVAVTSNESGTFTFVPDDPAQPSSAGRYRTGFHSTFTQTVGLDTSVLVVVGRTETGELVRFQIRSHFTFAGGEIRADHFEVNCA
jgi:hypothetical protein